MQDLSKIISRIMECIAEAHSFTQGLDLPTANYLQRDYLLNKLDDLSVPEINLALLELNKRKVIDFDLFSGLIKIN